MGENEFPPQCGTSRVLRLQPPEPPASIMFKWAKRHPAWHSLALRIPFGHCAHPGSPPPQGTSRRGWCRQTGFTGCLRGTVKKGNCEGDPLASSSNVSAHLSSDVHLLPQFPRPWPLSPPLFSAFPRFLTPLLTPENGAVEPYFIFPSPFDHIYMAQVCVCVVWGRGTHCISTEFFQAIF